MKYKVRLIKEYIKIAGSKEEAIESAKFDFDYSNDSSFCQQWDKVQCRECKAESRGNDDKRRSNQYSRRI